MIFKCIAIGNRIMRDDSIGIKVLEKLEETLSKQNVEIVFGETDSDFALSNINDGDYLFILDSTYLNTVPGKVTIIPLKEAILKHHQNYTQHQSSLINLLRLYKKSVKGFVIGIEVKEIDFGLELSDVLKKKFLNICEEVFNFIQNTIRPANSCQ